MAGEQLTWLDGAPAASLPLPDRGLDFGDGLFETLLLRAGTPLFPELHRARFRRGCDCLSLPDCGDRLFDDIGAFGATLAQAHPWVALRATVTRGAGPRGYAPPQQPTPRIVLSATPLARDAFTQLPPATIVAAQTRLALQPALAGVKHLNRLEQVLIAGEARAAGADDALVYDVEGRLVGVGSGNVFLVIDGKLFTPAMEGAGISGTRRALVCERWAPRLGCAVTVRELGPRDVERADEIFVCNSLVGIRSIGRLGSRRLENHGIAARLFAEYVRSCG